MLNITRPDGETAASAESAPHVRVEGLVKRFGGFTALSGAFFDVDRGRTLAIVGPSGCGKTTLLRIIAGLDVPDAGKVIIGGTVLTGPAGVVAPDRRRVGMVFQGGALFPHMTVAENVGYGIPQAPDRNARIRAKLAMVDLTGFEHRYPDSLSGGQAQRVALARALAPEPDVLLLDEPFANLDDELRVRVRSDVAALLRSLEITAIFVTHDQEEAFVIGDEVAVMRDGSIEQVGVPAEIYHHPASAWIARFVGDANILPGIRDGELIDTAIGMLPTNVTSGTSVAVMVRPEQLEITSGGRGVITGVEFYGHDTAYMVDVAGEQVIVRMLSAPRHRVGDTVHVRHLGDAVHVFEDRPVAQAGL